MDTEQTIEKINEIFQSDGFLNCLNCENSTEESGIEIIVWHGQVTETRCRRCGEITVLRNAPDELA